MLQSEHPSPVSSQAILKTGGSAENCAGWLFSSGRPSGHFLRPVLEQTELVVAQPLQEPCAMAALLWLPSFQKFLKPVQSVALNSRNNWFFRPLRKSVIYADEVWCN